MPVNELVRPDKPQQSCGCSRAAVPAVMREARSQKCREQRAIVEALRQAAPKKDPRTSARLDAMARAREARSSKCQERRVSTELWGVWNSRPLVTKRVGRVHVLQDDMGEERC